MPEEPQDIESELFAAELGADVPEVDLHGLDANVAEMEVESLLQQAFMNGDRVVRIVHGHGQGVLRDQIRGQLRESEIVETFRDSDQPGQLGAVTVVAIAPRDK